MKVSEEMEKRVEEEKAKENETPTAKMILPRNGLSPVLFYLLS